MVGAASPLQRAGYCTLIGALDAQQTAALRAEARRHAREARRVAGDSRHVNADGSITSPRKLATASAGPILEAVHRDSDRLRLLELLELLAERGISPTLAAYRALDRMRREFSRADRERKPEHALAVEAQGTNWPRIARLYRALMRVSPSPVIELNRLVAVAMAEGPEHAYPGLAALAEPLEQYAYFHATRAEMLRRLGRQDEEIGAYKRAVELEQNEAQRAFLQRTIAELTTSASAID